MKKYFFLLLLLPTLASFTMHKYYLSVTDLNYNKEAKAVQMITRIFYDDLEDVLRERYDTTVTVDATANQEILDRYLSKYLTAKMKVSINGNTVPINFIGKEYEDDYVVCYVEIVDVEGITSFTMTNELLMDVFPEQKNMLHTNMNSNKKSFLLTRENAKAVLNFSE